MITLNQIIKNKNKKINLNKFKYPQKKAICLKFFIKNPKKPNSALRKVALVKVNAFKKNIIAYVPGEKAYLQQHNYVLIYKHKTKDLPGVKFRVIRGVYDINCVMNRKNSRSKYGTKKNG